MYTENKKFDKYNIRVLSKAPYKNNHFTSRLSITHFILEVEKTNS